MFVALQQGAVGNEAARAQVAVRRSWDLEPGQATSPFASTGGWEMGRPFNFDNGVLFQVIVVNQIRRFLYVVTTPKP
ncbi:hypothetical protein EVAR_96210_1 [Eumeta japonica]|uniref:Uncharacterized protein n=1 Tax=Eumeta variegata TaxID=151549 RepID=A0A4C1T5G3_EUMVA|nr:hypothetical protein EVAR_96210_1 [Eumeta japonica]